MRELTTDFPVNSMFLASGAEILQLCGWKFGCFAQEIVHKFLNYIGKRLLPQETSAPFLTLENEFDNLKIE